jgi:hypothetical protein
MATAGTPALPSSQPVIAIRDVVNAVAGRSLFNGLNFKVAHGTGIMLMRQSGSLEGPVHFRHLASDYFNELPGAPASSKP